MTQTDQTKNRRRRRRGHVAVMSGSWDTVVVDKAVSTLDNHYRFVFFLLPRGEIVSSDTLRKCQTVSAIGRPVERHMFFFFLPSRI